MTALKSLLLAASLALTGCAGGPRQPDWQLEAKGAGDRFVSAYLTGSRAADAEWQRMSRSLASTARPELVARAELLACAVQVASLDWRPRCEGFEAMRGAAQPAELAYADYLGGNLRPDQLSLLPQAQRRIAEQGPQALPGVEDPLARLLGASVLLRSGRVPPQEQAELIAMAVETASSQGWRRPLLAWLGLQLDQAQAGGRTAEVDRVRLRLKLLREQR